MSNKLAILDGHPVLAMNGKKPERKDASAFLSTVTRRANLSYDAARSGTDLDNHWAFADALDSDTSNSKAVRHTLIKRSRYEQGSNGYYDGSLIKHVNRIVGTGPSLRMLTGNKDFNQLVEREFSKWAATVQLRRKLWAMAHARYGDGETFAILQTNPSVRNGVQLDFMPIEAEQCQSQFELMETGRIDGIIFDQFNNIVGYDILPSHPGAHTLFFTWKPIRVAAKDVVHWFKLKRPGGHRGVPDMTSTLTVGATSRRHREATVTAAETAADIAAMLTTTLGPAGDSEPDPVAPFTSIEFARRMMMVAPMGWHATQMKGEHPNAEYETFQRTQCGELTAPIAQPVNVTQGDSSNYSFASGKLDTILYREMVDIERADCNDLILDPLFAAWFREWTIIIDRRDIPPAHQWDWPVHPIIDAVSEASATDTKLKNGTITLRQVYSDQGKDLEDELSVMAEDTFGEATDETIDKCRKMLRLVNTPAHAINQVAQLLGIAMPKQATPNLAPEAAVAD